MIKTLALAGLLTAAAIPAFAKTCGATDCTDSVELVRVGDILDRGEFSLLLMADYYGLPPVADGWVYMRKGAQVFRVDFDTHEVLADVTDQTAANWF